ncbi:MAG: nodulation protein NfeD, partial [Flavisolibacter sp.]|nr:nodulation protein NfeD [Flavisolibacter sp.]
IKINGGINPASAEYIHKAIEKAETEKYECLLIHLNTPGGLLTSTREIVSDILKSRVPVVVYISPAGAHAGSAGVFITLAANIAVMAPGTNIGAAHPVAGQGQMDTTMNEKVTNDAAAFVRTIAEKRNRNAAWAEEAVRNSVSITATEAVNSKVVDLLTMDVKHLMEQIDGRSVETISGTVTLQTKNATVEPAEMRLIEKILNILSDPNLAYILLMIGFYGILFELYNPGAVLPGVLGVLGLILGLYALHALPVNYAGLALIIFGIILFLLEIKITSYGTLTIGGIIALLMGSMMLIEEDPTLPFMRISRTVIFTFTALSALFFLFVVGAGISAQKLKPVTGMEGFMGETGIALDTLDPLGTVRVHGEIWQAEAVAGKINPGEKIRILSMKNFKLKVEAFETSK